MKKTNRLSTVSIIYISAGIIFLCGVIWITWAWYYGSHHFDRSFLLRDEVNGFEVAVAEPCEFVRHLDGVCVEHADDVDPKLVAVMIENHVDARPQSGLSQASVVYEAPVEANYSRFMAIFPIDGEVLKAGPVRSARPYYLDWLAEYDNIMYMHVGGSPDALDIIKARDVFDLNEFYRGWYYWRSKDRYAPHNVYTASELWGEAFKSEGERVKGEEDRENWTFDERETCEDICVNEIDVAFLAPSYEAVWKFNTSTDKYARYQMGYPHIDKSGEAIEADTIIVQYVETQVLDAVGRLAMDTIGQGKAEIFRDGYMTRGVWKKDSVTSKTLWLDDEGEVIPLKAGKIWIEVVNQRGYVDTGDE